MAPSEGLSLYQYHGCPFCRQVRDAAQSLGVELELRDTLADLDYAREVVQATGRRTVPVLRIEEAGGEVRWLPESVDIIAYLQQRFS